MPRRRNSWGSVTRVAKGRYRLRYWGTDATGTYRRMSETVDGTRRDAEGMLARRRVEHDSEHATPTVGQAYETWWVPWAERRVTDGRMARARSCSSSQRGVTTWPRGGRTRSSTR